MTDKPARYSSPAIALHWLIALALFGLIGLGFYMTGLPMSPAKLQYFSWHKWAGVTIFLLVLVRLGWRLVSPPPAMPAATSPLMLAIPLSGWLMSSAKGFQTVWFGVLPLPDLIGRNLELGKQLSTLHLGLNVALLVMVAGHLLAALVHQHVQKDGTMYRMLPIARLRPSVAID